MVPDPRALANDQTRRSHHECKAQFWVAIKAEDSSFVEQTCRYVPVTQMVTQHETVAGSWMLIVLCATTTATCQNVVSG